MCHEQGCHPRFIHANADAVARHAWLCYFKYRTTDAVAIADADLVLVAAGGAGNVWADESRVIVFGTGHRIIAKGEPITELDQDAYSQDLIAIVAKAAGLKARIVEKDSLNELVVALASGEIDVVAMVARVPERSGSMLFSV